MRITEAPFTVQSARIVVRNVMRESFRRNPFLRNFESAIRAEKKAPEKIAERMLLDIFDPTSEVSYLLLGGLPGSGKTTFAEALAATVRRISLGMILVERRSFSDFRKKAISYMESTGEVWTKKRETELATEFMKQDALQTVKEGPRLRNGRRRLVIAEMPIYPVDENQRGLIVAEAIANAQKGVPYHKRRARVTFVKPDIDVIKNALITRIMHKSSGGSPEMLLQIAEKAYGGALLFRQLQPQLYKMLDTLIRDDVSFPRRKNTYANQASRAVALRMLAILQSVGLYGPVDTVIMNPVRFRLRRLSRQVPQQGAE